MEISKEELKELKRDFLGELVGVGGIQVEVPRRHCLTYGRYYIKPPSIFGFAWAYTDLSGKVYTGCSASLLDAGRMIEAETGEIPVAYDPSDGQGGQE